MPPRSERISVCADCDCIQAIPKLRDGTAALCARCGAELFRCQDASLDRTLAFLAAALVAYLFANADILMQFETRGLLRETTLFGTAEALRDHNMQGMGLLVAFTTIFVPAVELGLMLGLLVPLKLGYVPPWIAPAFRMIAVARPWVMLDVFLLAVIVTFARLASTDQAYAGAGLYGLAAFVLLRALALQAYEPDEVWRRVDEIDGVPSRNIETLGDRPLAEPPSGLSPKVWS